MGFIKNFFGKKKSQPPQEQELSISVAGQDFLTPLYTDRDYVVKRSEGRLPESGLDFVNYSLVDRSTNKEAASASLFVSAKKVKVDMVRTSSEYRRLGMQDLLLGLIEQEARNKGISKLTLESLEGAKSLYESKGYKKVEGYPPWTSYEKAVEKDIKFKRIKKFSERSNPEFYVSGSKGKAGKTRSKTLRERIASRFKKTRRLR